MRQPVTRRRALVLACAATGLAGTYPALAQRDSTAIGHVRDATGNNRLFRGWDDSMRARPFQEVEEADRFVVSEHLVIALNDDGLLDLGPGTDFTIATFRYDPVGPLGRLEADFALGAARLRTGAIGALDGPSVIWRLPFARLVIRDCTVLAEVESETQGTVAAVAFGTHPAAGIQVEGAWGTVTLDGDGHGTRFTQRGRPPTQPDTFSVDQLKRLEESATGVV